MITINPEAFNFKFKFQAEPAQTRDGTSSILYYHYFIMKYEIIDFLNTSIIHNPIFLTFANGIYKNFIMSKTSISTLKIFHYSNNNSSFKTIIGLNNILKSSDIIKNNNNKKKR